MAYLKAPLKNIFAQSCSQANDPNHITFLYSAKCLLLTEVSFPSWFLIIIMPTTELSSTSISERAMATFVCFILISVICGGAFTSVEDQNLEEKSDPGEDTSHLNSLVEDRELEQDHDHRVDPDLSAATDDDLEEKRQSDGHGLPSLRSCGQNDETCKRDTAQRVPCSHLPGGLRRLTLGVHIANLTLRPLDYIAPDGYALPVIGLNCRKDRTWTNQQNSVAYLKPEEVSNIHNINAGNLQASSEVFKSSWDVKDSIEAHIEVSGIYKKVGGSLGATFQRMSQEIRQNERKITDVSAFTAAMEVQFRDFGLTLDAHAQKYLDRLPDDITKDREGYAKFVDLFGTHHFRVGKLGGILKSTTTTDMSKVTDISEFDISAEASSNFVIKIITVGLAGGIGYDKRQLTSNFSTTSSTKIRFYGGNTNLLEKDGIKKWQPTVYDEPWVYWGSFREIYHLLDENDKKREALKIAVESRLNEDFKKHLVQTFNEVLTVYQKLSISVTALTKLKVDLDKEVNNQFPLFSELSKIEKKLRAIVNPPKWWKLVKLCFDVRGEYPSFKKFPHIWNDKTLCAQTDSFTEKYWTKVYPGSYVSEMKWGIMTKGYYDSYFSQVEWCVRYKPIRKHICSPEVFHTKNLEEECAPINSFTPVLFYSMRTDRNGCAFVFRSHCRKSYEHFFKEQDIDKFCSVIF